MQFNHIFNNNISKEFSIYCMPYTFKYHAFFQNTTLLTRWKIFAISQMVLQLLAGAYRPKHACCSLDLDLRSDLSVSDLEDRVQFNMGKNRVLARGELSAPGVDVS